MTTAEYAKVNIFGQVTSQNNRSPRPFTQTYATLVRNNEQYRNAVMRLSTGAINHFMRNYNTNGRRPSFREVPGGPFSSCNGAIFIP